MKSKAEQNRLNGIHRSKKLGIYHNSKLRFTKYNKNLKNAFNEYLNRNVNHMSIKNIADTNNMSRSTLYKKIRKYKPHQDQQINGTRAFSDWIGGKARHSILSKLQSFMPDNYDPDTNYFYELFSGMASLSFSVQPKHLILNDNDSLVINCFKVVKNQPKHLVHQVKQQISKNSKDYFYHIRSIVNLDTTSALDRASGLIYLTSTSFNGFIRMNRLGELNMAWGKGRCNPPSYQTILKDSEYLNNTDLHLLTTDFENVFKDHPEIRPKVHDFVYFDPPYIRGYKLYGKKVFDLDDLVRLRNLCILLSYRHVFVMISNYDTKLVRDLFFGRPFKIHPFMSADAVNGNGKGRKRKYREVIITNY